MSLKTIRRIKWRNIFGLIFLVIVVFFIFAVITWITFLIEGDCVEKNNTKVCFTLSKDTVPRGSDVSITAVASNLGESVKGVGITMLLSPNLKNTSAGFQSIDALSPGDSVERTFTIRTTNERGRFKISFDIDSNGKSDKDLFLNVE